MPLEARTELRAQEGRRRAIQEARGKVIDGAREIARASEYTIIIAGTGVAMVDGTSITDAALARKLEAAVKRDVAIKVRVAYDVKLADRFAVVHSLVKKAGVTNVEVSTSIVTQVPDKGPPPVDNSPTIVLTVDNKGGLILGSRRVTDAELDGELATLAKRTKKIALAADSATTYATIVKLMDRCKAAGLTDIMFTGN